MHKVDSVIFDLIESIKDFGHIINELSHQVNCIATAQPDCEELGDLGGER